MESASTASVDKKEGSVHAYHSTVNSKEVDVAANLTAGKEIEFTPEEAAAVRCVPERALFRGYRLSDVTGLFQAKD